MDIGKVTRENEGKLSHRGSEVTYPGFVAEKCHLSACTWRESSGGYKDVEGSGASW